MKEILKRASELSDVVRKAEEVTVVTHIDADGITSGAIAYRCLERAGKEVRIRFVKSLDDEEIERIANESTFVWFTDLGSGQISSIEKSGLNFIVTDHHVPEKVTENQLNPHIFGYDGSYELSGATTTYLLARALGLNYDLSAIAIVGAVGDLQDSNYGRLIGLNSSIVDEAVRNGYVKVVRDLKFFGKQTRPVYKMLEYTFDPYMPGISGSERGAIRFLDSIGVRVKDGERWLRWIDLSEEEKRKAVSEIVRLLMSSNTPFSQIMRMVGDTYILLEEEEGSELRDAMEFSTLLNATARYGEEEVGLLVCLGDRGKAFSRARSLLQNHRRNLSDGLRLVDEIGIEEMQNIQYFHAGRKILDTIVGIVAGMSYSFANRNKPIIAFAENEDGVKVSARATKLLVERGVHLAQAIKIAAEKVGGKGGGHSIAAGATIPKGSEEEFLRILDRVIGEQFCK
ncbi:Single-stranded DNA-specific exonuclease [Geoglobus ahangari]|uniref:Single-stranded DNA-specific exonuclease n=1 Tax=Geoglobus ahangari TaxID=113653 RepID=A0A0F7II54_9EURY|nr:DHH family phosphoesterase [Geoglobus ahangari]AKG92462.1 Single-stranded DNA-specific exonuclease [Geoglobus ahangari]